MLAAGVRRYPLSSAILHFSVSRSLASDTSSRLGTEAVILCAFKGELDVEFRRVGPLQNHQRKTGTHAVIHRLAPDPRGPLVSAR